MERVNCRWFRAPATSVTCSPSRFATAGFLSPEASAKDPGQSAAELDREPPIGNEADRVDQRTQRRGGFVT
jgi:hypothetical protein